MSPNWQITSLLAAAVLVGPGCGERTNEPDVVAPTSGPGIGSTRASPEPSAEAPPSVQKFHEEVAAIGSTGREDHAQIAAALRSLSEAIPVVGNPDTRALVRMRHQIEQLEKSSPSSRLHANYVRGALDEVVTMAASGAPRNRSDTAKYTRELAALAVASRQVDPDQPLMEQQGLVARALERAVRLLYVAVGAPPPASSPADNA